MLENKNKQKVCYSVNILRSWIVTAYFYYILKNIM